MDKQYGCAVNKTVHKNRELNLVYGQQFGDPALKDKVQESGYDILTSFYMRSFCDTATRNLLLHLPQKCC